jgi:hypothetical protein
MASQQPQQWADPSVYAQVYAQADATSSESMSDEAADVCRFIHSQCDKELFTSEYLRCVVALPLWNGRTKFYLHTQSPTNMCSCDCYGEQEQ